MKVVVEASRSVLWLCCLPFLSPRPLVTIEADSAPRGTLGQHQQSRFVCDRRASRPHSSVLSAWPRCASMRTTCVPRDSSAHRARRCCTSGHQAKPGQVKPSQVSLLRPRMPTSTASPLSWLCTPFGSRAPCEFNHIVREWHQRQLDRPPAQKGARVQTLGGDAIWCP